MVHSSVHRRIEKTFENEKEEEVRFLQRLLRIPSVTGKENKAQELVVEKLNELGLEVDVWTPHIEELRRTFPRFESMMPLENRPNVVGIARGAGSGRSIILNAHIDVIEPGEREKWRYDPWGGVVKDGKIYGRGATDCKGGLVALIYAVDVLQRAGVQLRGDVILESVIDEEEGCAGTLACVAKGYRADAGIVAEPTDLQVMPVGSGMIRFMIKVEGKAAHGAQRWLGVSAFEKALTIHSALMKLEERRMRTKRHHLFGVYPKFPALNVGIVTSGTTPYTTPDAAILEGRYSVSPVETMDEAKKEFESQVITAANKDPWMKHVPPTIVWSQIGQGLFPPFEVSTENPLVKSICKSLKKITGKEPKVLGKLGATDASWLNTYGHTPTIIFGPGHTECSHTIDEYIHKNALITATKALAEFLVDWCICET